MQLRAAAYLDGPGRYGMNLARPVGPRPRIIATVTPDTPYLQQVDMIRLDGAFRTLTEMARLRDRYLCPTMLDIPGRDTRIRTSILTASDQLVFASAEGFDWVSLRGVVDVREVQSARELLDPAVGLAATIGRPEILTTRLAEICQVADAVIVNQERLADLVGWDRSRDYLQKAVVETTRLRRPILVASGLLSSMTDSMFPDPFQIERIHELNDSGFSGFILCDETSRGRHPQACVETMHMVTAVEPSIRPVRRVGANVAGAPELLDPPNTQN